MLLAAAVERPALRGFFGVASFFTLFGAGVGSGFFAPGNAGSERTVNATASSSTHVVAAAGVRVATASRRSGQPI